MNKYLFAYNIRQNALLFLIILSVLLLYFSIIIPMYDPAGNEDLIAMASMKMSPERIWLKLLRRRRMAASPADKAKRWEV